MAVEPKKHTNAQWGAWIWIKWKAGAPEDAWNSWKNNREVKAA